MNPLTCPVCRYERKAADSGSLFECPNCHALYAASKAKPLYVHIKPAWAWPSLRRGVTWGALISLTIGLYLLFGFLYVLLINDWPPFWPPSGLIFLLLSLGVNLLFPDPQGQATLVLGTLILGPIFLGTGAICTVGGLIGLIASARSKASATS